MYRVVFSRFGVWGSVEGSGLLAGFRGLVKGLTHLRCNRFRTWLLDDLWFAAFVRDTLTPHNPVVKDYF